VPAQTDVIWKFRHLWPKSCQRTWKEEGTAPEGDRGQHGQIRRIDPFVVLQCLCYRGKWQGDPAACAEKDRAIHVYQVPDLSKKTGRVDEVLSECEKTTWSRCNNGLQGRNWMRAHKVVGGDKEWVRVGHFITKSLATTKEKDIFRYEKGGIEKTQRWQARKLPGSVLGKLG